MTKMTGKRALMEMLRAEGVKHIFGNPGTSEGPILSALEDFPDIEYMLTTQEGVAMGMADAYARATGKPSFVNLHIETGLANGISLLHNANEGGTPLVLTSANKDIRALAQGRTELAEMVRLFTKWTAEVTHPEQVPSVMRRAFNEAKTPPTGPTYVAFSANALDDEADMEIVPSPAGYFRTAPDGSAIEEASRMLAGASNPMMVIGDRIAQSDGSAEAVRLAELLGAKVYATVYSEMNFPTGHGQFMGRLNSVLPATRELFSSADVVLAVGTNVFSGYFYFSGRALGPKTKLKKEWDLRPMSAGRMMSEIAGALPSDTIIVDDAVTTGAALHQSIEFNEPGSLFGGRGGALGWGMGGAMGVKMAHPERPVVAIVGDGSSMMTVQALWTASTTNIPVVYVICNNSSYRVLKLNMNVYKKDVLGEDPPQSQYLGTDLPIRLNVAGIAEAIGVHGRQISDPSELAGAVKEALALGKPAVLDVVIDGAI
jgi:benzoylformate decarboxylase